MINAKLLPRLAVFVCMACSGAKPQTVTLQPIPLKTAVVPAEAPPDTLIPVAEWPEEVAAGSRLPADVMQDTRPVPPERSKQAIRQVLRQNARTILPCAYVLKEHPRLNGDVVMRLEVTPAGRVTAIEVIENTTESELLGACLAEIADVWVFLPVDEDRSRFVTVTIPFRMGEDNR